MPVKHSNVLPMTPVDKTKKWMIGIFIRGGNNWIVDKIFYLCSPLGVRQHITQLLLGAQCKAITVISGTRNSKAAAV